MWNHAKCGWIKKCVWVKFPFITLITQVSSCFTTTCFFERLPLGLWCVCVKVWGIAYVSIEHQRFGFFSFFLSLSLISKIQCLWWNYFSFGFFIIRFINYHHNHNHTTPLQTSNSRLNKAIKIIIPFKANFEAKQLILAICFVFCCMDKWMAFFLFCC